MDFYIVDVFAEQKYRGNQLAVLVPDRCIETAEMQQIAQEIGFSETTFVLSGKQENGGYEVRIFTPQREVPFAGHPTIGTAYIVNKTLETGIINGGLILLNLKIGTIPVAIDVEGLTMRQNQPSFDIIIENSNMVADILRIDKSNIDTNLPIQVVSTGLPCIIVPLKSVDAVKQCVLDHPKFQIFIDSIYKCNLLVFASDHENNLYVRVFLDDPGFLEDPATGSANGNLASYLLRYDYFHRSKVSYHVKQGYEINRPSVIKVRAKVDDGEFEIFIGGNVHMVAKGEWC